MFSEGSSWSGLRPNTLTLIFDQSYSRGSKEADMQKKLFFFEERGIYGFVYSSHATFLLLGADSGLVRQARAKLLEVSSLPEHRLVTLRSSTAPPTN
jgi:hypothetical protein